MTGAPRVGVSLKAKSTALFVLYLLALTAVYVTLSLRLLQRENEAAVDRLRQTAAILAAEVDRQIEAGIQRLETVGKLPGLTFGLESLVGTSGGRAIPAWTTLHYLFFKQPLFTGGVFLVDRAGTVLWNEPPDRDWQGIWLSNEATLRAALARKGTAVSGALASGALVRTPHALVVSPIQQRRGEVVGFVGGMIDLQSSPLLAIADAASREGARFVVVVDDGGRIVASTIGLPLAEVWAPAAAGQGVLLEAKPLGRGGWRVWVGEPEVSALAAFRQLERLLFWLGLALVAVTATIGSSFIRNFTSGVTTLTQHAEIMASGDLSRPVRLVRRDELGVLAATFERMRTELSRSQQALEERLTERDELLRLKEEFLANTSHELRTPLNVISGYTQMLEDDESDAERRGILEGIRCQAGRLLDLFKDLMTISGLNAGRLEVRAARVEVPAVLARLAPLVAQPSGGREIDAVWDVPHDLPPIYTDELRLEQVLANLLVNAVKFTHKGKIAIRVRVSDEEHAMTFAISDTGIGIPEHELPYIFDEFRQVDGSMSRTHGGMGLGLAVVKKLVTLLGGEIRVQSLEGLGSMFSVTLPLGEEHVVPAAQQEHTAAALDAR